MLRRTLLVAVPLVLSGLLAACGDDDNNATPAATTVTPASVDAVQVAQSAPEFSILVEALTAANLVTTLKGPGPFTVFAPTNDAFAALLTELGLTKAQLLANTALLTQVLTYHVLPANVPKAQVPAGKAITSVQGGVFKIDGVGTDLIITDGRNRTSRITATDIAASNGVIHRIDKVILPADKNIVQTALAVSRFSILAEAVVAANLQGTLSGAGPFTVFAPNNTAFANLLTELGVTKDQLLNNAGLLTKVLTYHVVPGRVLKADIKTDTPITTVQGETFLIDRVSAITDQRTRRSNIIATDIFAVNGVIHEIDKVILPRP